MEKPALNAARLRELLRYDPDTGQFSWVIATTNRVKAGDAAGCLQARGYIAIGLLGKHWPAHRLAWLYMTGAHPHGQIDHINRCRTDNRFANLRVVSNAENQHNGSVRKNNRSGVHGVSWDEKRGKWLAKICVNRKQKHLGLFVDLGDAARARRQAELQLHPARTQSL